MYICLGLQSNPLLCDSSRRASDIGHQIGHWRVGHRTPDIGHRFRVTSDFRSFVIQFSYARRRVWCPMYSVQCLVSNVRCPVSIIGVSVTFLPDTGHRTIPSNLALWPGGGGYSVTLYMLNNFWVF